MKNGSSPTSLNQATLNSILSVPSKGWPNSPVQSVETLIPNNGGRASFGPQGTIAYSLLDNNVNGTKYADIWTMNSEGTNQHCITCNNPLVPHLSDDVPLWDPNGKFIVFEGQNPNLGQISPHLSQGGAGFNNDLWAITPNGSEAFKLTSTQRGEAVLHPQFSPNGDELVWAGYDKVKKLGGLIHQGNWDIHVATFNISQTGQPSLSNELIFRPGSPNHNTFYETHDVLANGTIIFSSNMASQYESQCKSCALGIWEWNPNLNNTPTLLTQNTNAWNEHAAITPSLSHIVWISSQNENFTPSSNWGATLRTDWWIMNQDGSTKTRVTYFNTQTPTNVRVICAEGSWNSSGTSLVASVDVISATTSVTRIVLINFKTQM